VAVNILFGPSRTELRWLISNGIIKLSKILHRFSPINRNYPRSDFEGKYFWFGYNAVSCFHSSIFDVLFPKIFFALTSFLNLIFKSLGKDFYLMIKCFGQRFFQ